MHLGQERVASAGIVEVILIEGLQRLGLLGKRPQLRDEVDRSVRLSPKQAERRPPRTAAELHAQLVPHLFQAAT